MIELIPYLGTAVIIVVATAAFVVLARHGFRLKRLKHDKIELEFENSMRQQITSKCRTTPRIILTEATVQLNPAAKGDCDKLSISPEEPVQFVLGEAIRHPLLFDAEFTSLPLVFGENVLLLSWDRSEAKVERILNREEAYPLNDAWSTCLALYRQATLLPYRTRGPEQLYTSTEAKRAVAIYRRLVLTVEDFLSLLREKNQEYPDVYQDMGSLVEEAEFALANEDIGTSVARLEVVLSTIHKLILNCAPQGQLTMQVAAKSQPKVEVPADDRPTVLVVDDCYDFLIDFRDLLQQHGYAVIAADTTTAALRAMVEHEFDLVITDMVMPQADGREVVLAVKNSSDKTKVIVVTGYPEMSRIADLMKAGVDSFIPKPYAIMDILAEIERLLDRPRVDQKRKELERKGGAKEEDVPDKQ